MGMILKFHEGVLVNGRRVVTCDIDGERFADFAAFRKHIECVHPEEIARTEKAKREWMERRKKESNPPTPKNDKKQHTKQEQ